MITNQLISNLRTRCHSFSCIYSLYFTPKTIILLRNWCTQYLVKLLSFLALFNDLPFGTTTNDILVYIPHELTVT